MEAGGARGRAYLGGVVDWGYPILTRHAIRWISRFGQKKEAGLGPGLNLKPHETVTSRCGAAALKARGDLYARSRRLVTSCGIPAMRICRKRKVFEHA